MGCKMPKGKKICPSCKVETGARLKICSCGYDFNSGELVKSLIRKSEFSINERFKFIENLVNMVANHIQPSAIISGKGGLGKTYTVIQSLRKNNLRDVSCSETTGYNSDEYRIVKGYSTAKGLYRTLFDNRNGLLVLDDTDAVFDNDISLNILKAALDSYDRRIISWNAEIKGDDLPREFEYKGRIVFITNREVTRIDQAIRSRSMIVDLSMTNEEMIERMEYLVDQPGFLPEYDADTKLSSICFLRDHIDECKDISLRTLINVVKICKNGGDWEKFARYTLTTSSAA